MSSKTKSSSPVSASVVGVSSRAVTPIVSGTAGSTAAGSSSSTSTSTSNAAAGGTGSGNSSAGGVLAGLGITNAGFNQVQVKSVATAAFLAKLQKRLNGLQNNMPADSSLVLMGTTYTVTAIVSVLQAVVALFTAKATAQQQAKTLISAAVAALNAELPVANQFLTSLDGALVVLFGKGNPVLGNFGLSTGIKKTPTVTTKAQAKGTAELTRKARNTMGKVQRLKVTGGTAQVAVTGPGGQALSGSTTGVAVEPVAAGPVASSTSSNGSSGSNNSGQ